MVNGGVLHQGLAYIHKSTLRAHGQLTSLTCHVDNRWTLKIGCIRLPIFADDAPRGVAEGDEGAGPDVYAGMLWTAPELILEAKEKRTIGGVQKGDVYSFGIVLQEIAYRAAPFFNEDRSARGNCIFMGYSGNVDV